MNFPPRLFLPVFGTLCLSALAALAEPEGPPSAPKVTAEEIEAALAQLEPREQAALAADPALLKQVVRLTLAQRLLLREARDDKWDERPDVKAKLERARDKALAESWLQAAAALPPGYPGEEEIKAAYEAKKDSLATPRQFRMAQIFIACPKNADKATLKKAEARLAAVKQKLAAYKLVFSDIARGDSEEAASAANGGEIGWMTEAQIQPELRPLITKLIQHEVSAPVRLNDGWHILKCLDKREAGTPSLDDVRDRLVTQLRAERTEAVSEARVARLLETNPVAIDEEALTRRCAERAGVSPLQTSNFKAPPDLKSPLPGVVPDVPGHASD